MDNTPINQNTVTQSPVPAAKPANNRPLIIVIVVMVAVLLLAGLLLLGLPLLLNLLNPTIIPVTTSPTPTILPTTTNAADIVTVHGRIFYSGISETESPLLRALNSTYQITDLEDTSRTLDGKTVVGYYLVETNIDISQFAGKCVSLSAQRVPGWQNVNTDDTYDRLALAPFSIATSDNCSPYVTSTTPELTGAPDAHYFTLSGTLHVGPRPVPDMGYDYYLTLDTPRLDNENASGMTQTVTEQPVQPLTPAVFDKFLQYQGRHVQITGFLAWGYAESTFIYVQTIQPQ